jgi:hypothetical protein
MEQFGKNSIEAPAPKKRLNQKKIGLLKKAEKEAAERALLEEEDKKKKLAAEEKLAKKEKELAKKVSAIDKDFLPKFAERIKGWLEIIDLSNLDKFAKNEFKLEILDNNDLINANKEIKEKLNDFNTIWFRFHDFISAILSERDKLRQEGRGKPEELNALFENIRDDIWAFRDENKTKKD